MNKNRESRKFRLNKQSRSFTNHFRLQVEKAAESFRQHRDDLHEITTDTGPYFGLTVPPVVERRERPRDVLERYRQEAPLIC